MYRSSDCFGVSVLCHRVERLRCTGFLGSPMFRSASRLGGQTIRLLRDRLPCSAYDDAKARRWLVPEYSHADRGHKASYVIGDNQFTVEGLQGGGEEPTGEVVILP